MNQQTESTWHHPYLWDIFPGYDYRNPTEPWNLHCGNKDGIRLCAWQMKAFHYWWIVEQCEKRGEVGLGIGVDQPFCVNVSGEKGKGQVWSHANSIHKILEPESVPLIIASAAIPAIECGAESNARCTGVEIIPYIVNWMTLLKPDGVLIATVIDNTGALAEGRSLIEHPTYKHAWTARQFEKYIISALHEGHKNIEVSEFDTLKSGMAFNLVLRKK